PSHFHTVTHSSHLHPLSLHDALPISKTTTFGVDIWRLSLPPGAFDYPQKVLHFSRIDDSFVLEVADANELRAIKWMKSSSYRGRSEEHTSELQSRFDLVCRLLLEKKK